MAKTPVFMRCKCHKMHTVSGIGPNSRCTCERYLWEQVYGPPTPDPIHLAAVASWVGFSL